VLVGVSYPVTPDETNCGSWDILCKFFSNTGRMGVLRLRGREAWRGSCSGGGDAPAVKRGCTPINCQIFDASSREQSQPTVLRPRYHHVPLMISVIVSSASAGGI